MALEFAADGRSLIVGENKQSVKNERRWPEMWLWPDGDPTRARQLATDWPLVGYHLSKDMRWGLTSHTTEPDITVWDPTTGRRVRNLGLSDPVTFELTPDGHWIFASIRERYQMVELGSWKFGATWPARFGQQHYRCWAFSPDSSLVATADPNGLIELRTLPDGTELIDLPGPKRTQIKALSFSPDGARLLTMTGAGSVQEWDLKKLRTALAAAKLAW
jgi:WD40 repeat protein